MPLSFDELDFGPPDYKEHLPPVCKDNYGKWSYHEHVKGGVIKHVTEDGKEAYTVRAAIPKYVAAETVHKLCDIADKYCEGYIRFTSRHNVSFIVPKAEDVDKVIEELEAMGMVVGGTDHSLKAIIQCVGWTHCHTPATDSPSIAKALYEEFYDEFKDPNAFPERVKIAVSGCLNMCGATHASDIAIIGMHRKPPVVIDELVEKFCSVPDLIKSCPKYAIKPKKGNPKSIEIDEEKCMYCGICYGMCEGAPIHNPDYDGVSIWVGGKASNTKKGPLLARLIIPFMPNEPPKWENVVKTIRKILDAYKANAEEDERIGEWIERIGWEKFFKIADIPFTDKSIDDWIFSVESYRRGTNFKMV